MSNEATRIIFNLTATDMMAFRQHFVHTSPFAVRKIRQGRAIRFVIGLIFTAWSLLMIYQFWDSRQTVVVTCGLLVYGIWSLVDGLWTFPKRYRKKWLQQMAKFDRDHPIESHFGRCSCCLEGDLLESASPMSTTKYLVAKLHDVAVYDSHAFIYVNGQAAIIIPQAGVIEGNYAAFLAEVRQRMGRKQTAP